MAGNPVMCPHESTSSKLHKSVNYSHFLDQFNDSHKKKWAIRIFLLFLGSFTLTVVVEAGDSVSLSNI